MKRTSLHSKQHTTQATRGAIYLVLAGFLAANTVYAQSAPSQSASNDRAATLIQEGRSLLAQGNANEALAKFREAWELGHSPTARAHMGVAEGALGHAVEAEQYLREGVEAPRDALMQDAWVERFRENLRVARRTVGRFMVRGEPAGAEVFLSGRSIGILPFAQPMYVRAESARLRVQLRGFYPVERDVTIGGDLAVTTEEVRLNPLVTDPNANTTATVATVPTQHVVVQQPVDPPRQNSTDAQRIVVVVNNTAPATGGLQSQPIAPPVERPRPSNPFVAVAITTGVLAGIGAGVGATGIGIASSNSDSFMRARCLPNIDVRSQCQEAYDWIVRGNYMTAAGFIPAGVFAVATVGFGIGAALTNANNARAEQAQRTAWLCLPSVSGVACSGTF
jgi:hypothetical protein